MVGVILAPTIFYLDIKNLLLYYTLHEREFTMGRKV
jgi:hypothetical protein